MSLFAISDLHLSLGVNKPMDIFGGWTDYMDRLKENWQKKIMPDDTVVIPGDLNWAMNFQQGYKDFEFLDKLNGKKIISKGNHDYWWNTKNKMDKFFADNGFNSINILHNNHYRYENFGICGTRGWINDNSEPADAKILAREATRLTTSIESALSENLVPVVFLHYPPLYAASCNYEILEVLHKYNIKDCFYGHVHGNAKKFTFIGERDGINYRLIASDFLQFDPMDITKIVQSDNL